MANGFEVSGRDASNGAIVALAAKLARIARASLPCGISFDGGEGQAAAA